MKGLESKDGNLLDRSVTTLRTLRQSSDVPDDYLIDLEQQANQHLARGDEIYTQLSDMLSDAIQEGRIITVSQDTQTGAVSVLSVASTPPASKLAGLFNSQPVSPMNARISPLHGSPDSYLNETLEVDTEPLVAALATLDPQTLLDPFTCVWQTDDLAYFSSTDKCQAMIAFCEKVNKLRITAAEALVSGNWNLLWDLLENQWGEYAGIVYIYTHTHTHTHTHKHTNTHTHTNIHKYINTYYLYTLHSTLYITLHKSLQSQKRRRM